MQAARIVDFEAHLAVAWWRIGIMDIDMSRRNRRPRPLSDSERARLEEFIESISDSNR